MLDEKILAYGSAKRFHRKTLERWLSLAENDQEALFDLAQVLKLGENHLKDFLEWLEEIALRDGVGLGEILQGDSMSRISSDSRLSRNDKLKQMKAELRRLRFPRLTSMEEQIRKRIHEMRLHPRIQMTVPPGLEGGVTVQMRAASHEELESLVGQLAQALEKKAVKEIFLLLGGQTEKLIAEKGRG